MELTTFHLSAIAVALGLLVGFQREWTKNPVAGIRTFPLITLLGVFCALLAERYGGWAMAAGLITVAAAVLLPRLIARRAARADVGITTEVAAMLMFAVGAALVAGHVVLSIVAAGAVAVLLHWKAPMHRFVGRVGEGELGAVIRLVLVAMVILPLLPDEPHGPYGVINPFDIWLMVVLIVGISFVGYIAYLLLGDKGGTLLAGVLGGFISSTATTVGYARWSHVAPARAHTATLVVMIASTVVFARVLVEVALVAPTQWRAMAGPLAVVMVAMTGIAAVAFFVMRRSLTHPAQRGEPPSNLLAAIVFGALYAAVLIAVAFAKEHFGQSGLYAVAALSGLTDMDAITLSSAQMVKAGTIQPGTGWRMIVVGGMANLVFKWIIAASLSGRGLLKPLSIVFGASFLAAAAVLVVWPN